MRKVYCCWRRWIVVVRREVGALVPALHRICTEGRLFFRGRKGLMHEAM